MGEQDTTEQPQELPAAQRRVVIRPRLHRALEGLAGDRETDITEEANRAIREMLEREGRWPPRSGKSDDDSGG